MIDLASYPNVDGAFPSVVTKDNTAPTSNDGTPLRKLLFDDIFGFFQAITDKGSITPSGTNETYDDSDLLNGIQNVSGGPGEICLFAGTPQMVYNSGKRLLQCAGQTMVITSYQDLVDATYRGDEFNNSVEGFYKSSDVNGFIRDIAGPYYTIHDFRGMFIRGIDNGGTIDPDYLTRDFLEVQDSAIKEHDHEIKVPGIGSSYSGYSAGIDVASGAAHMLRFLTTASFQAFASDFQDSNTVETRPININVLICVRY